MCRKCAAQALWIALPIATAHPYIPHSPIRLAA
ncbi:hypothetical protein FHS52_002650 [Erythromicrobium ramosum]|uniref:Uncharacterized protein n=1 Tax=Erythrobacter ramosus TaxID=35811 RepID=A0ABR6I159_9SPHN|nr:hypothetical protein [Erythrobacter ramosus]